MPELPEVQTIADGLNKKIKNAIISDVFCDWKKMIIHLTHKRNFVIILIYEFQKTKN
ncbi:MAG: DNA-formamidopyrimidine glycosylase family protein [bacterium]